MTAQKPKVTAKVTATTTATTTDGVVKKTRTRASRAKPKPEEAPVVVNDTTVTDDQKPQTHVVETENVELKDKDEFEFPDEDEIIATEVGSLDQEKKLGSNNYTIGAQSYNYQAINGNTDGQYPLHVWVRDSKSLLGMQMTAMERINNNVANPRDYWMMDYAEQNSILSDPHMSSFFAREGAKWENFLQLVIVIYEALRLTIVLSRLLVIRNEWFLY